jgi:hypothetical protein
MKTYQLILVALMLAVSQLMTSCATFKSDMRGKYVSATEKNYEADRVNALFIFSHFRQTRGLDAIPKLDNQYERIRGFDDFFQDALKEFSNVQSYATFTDYAADVNDPARRVLKDSLMHQHDYIIKMRFMREKSFSKTFLGAIASSLTLTLLPIPYTYSYSATAEVYDTQGHLLKNYARSAALTKWVQSLLIFIYPFHPEQRKKEELYVQFMHDIFKQIETEKILKKF